MHVTTLQLDLTPAELAISVDAKSDDSLIKIFVLTAAGTELYARIPERRCFARRLQQAQHLRDAAAELVTVDAFLAYIRDCGFIKQ